MNGKFEFENFNSPRLLDAVRQKLDLRSDRALAARLGVSAPAISKLRNNKLPVGAAMLLSMHEITGWSIRELRALMGDHRKYFASHGSTHRKARVSPGLIRTGVLLEHVH